MIRPTMKADRTYNRPRPGNAPVKVPIPGGGWLAPNCGALVQRAALVLLAAALIGQAAAAVRAQPSTGLTPRQAVLRLASVPKPARFSYRVVRTYPHDPQAFTQGLLYHQGRFYESTGLRGRSTLREVDPASGRILKQRFLPGTYFGEGLALHQERLYQLTWQRGTLFVYGLRDLGQQGTFSYPTEGWGLTHDGLYFIQSDGSDQLFYRAFDSFQLHHTLDVRDRGRPVTQINELEYIHGLIWANIWQTQRIALINPASGQVDAWVDLNGLAAQASDGRGGSVLNGIAHDPEGDRLWVTGKRWSLIFEIELVPPIAQ